jgi:RNA polymerase sigma factor for flagellar operon FliA
VFAQYLPLIDAITATIARRHHLSAEDAEDFASLVRVKLLEHDSAILRKFAGRSSPRTFLTTVIQRIFLDDRNSRWGKWRPSAEARRAGPIALLLERLVARDGLTFEEACSTLQITHGVHMSRAELDALYARLPVRIKRRVVADDDVVETLTATDGESPDVRFETEEQRPRDLERALARAIAGVAAEDRLILRLRFDEGQTVANIARITGTEQRLLYRRLEQLLERLRSSLEAEGFATSEAVSLLERPDVEFDGVFERAEKNPRPRPSTAVGGAEEGRA